MIQEVGSIGHTSQRYDVFTIQTKNINEKIKVQFSFNIRPNVGPSWDRGSLQECVCVCVCVCTLHHFIHVLTLFGTLCDCSLPSSSVHSILQARYWSGLPCPLLGDLSDPGMEPHLLCPLHLLHLQVDSLPLAPPMGKDKP